MESLRGRKNVSRKDNKNEHKDRKTFEEERIFRRRLYDRTPADGKGSLMCTNDKKCHFGSRCNTKGSRGSWTQLSTPKTSLR